MTDPTELQQCARGCTYPQEGMGEQPEPRPATHGVLCGRCFYRLTTALDTIPDLIRNMRSQIHKTGAQQYGERVGGSSSDGSPAPIAIDPLDASDSLFAKLVSWSEVFAGEFGIPQPRVAVWSNFREVQGFRPVTPDSARALTATLTGWMLAIIEDIAASAQAVEFHDDLCYGWDEARGVFPLLGRYGIEPRPERPPAQHACPVCNSGDIFVKWPDKFSPDLEVMCDRCRAVVDPDLVNRHARRVGILKTLHVTVTVTSTEIADVIAWHMGLPGHVYDARNEPVLAIYRKLTGTKRDDFWRKMPTGLQYAVHEVEQGRLTELMDTLEVLNEQARARIEFDKARAAARGVPL